MAHFADSLGAARPYRPELDTSTAGTHFFTVDATDVAGNPASTTVSYNVRAGDVSETVTGGETVTSDPGGLGASPSIPVQTQIVVPGGVSGSITVTPQPAGSPPAGFVFFGAAVALTGPVAPSAANPYLLTFMIDRSVIAPIDPSDVQVFRNGTAVADCTDVSAAIPDPCVSARGAVGGSSDDAFVTARTTHFSTWAVGRRAFSVTQVSPSSRARGVAHNIVRISGTGFVSGSTAAFPGGGVTVSSTTFVDAAHLAADVSITNAAALGARDVRVTRPGPPATNATCTGCFTVNPKPTVTAVAPSSRPQGATQDLTITGTDLGPDAVVAFSGTGVDVNSQSGGGTALVVNVSVSPSALVGAGSVTVANSDGGVVTKNNASTVNASPTANSVVPAALPRGKTLVVQINGSGFAANFVALGGTVSFGPSITVGTVTRTSPTLLRASVTISGAAQIGSYDVIVVNPDGGSAVCFNCFNVSAMPVISSVVPSSRGQGVLHQAIAVGGSGFQLGATVSISGAGVTINSVTRNDDSSLTLDVSITNAAAATARNIVVTNPDTGSVTCAGCLTVNPRPTLSTVVPSSRTAGSSYTIAVNGTPLQSGAAVSFSGSGIQVTSLSGSGASLSVDITIAYNATIGNHDVTVTNPDGGSATKTNALRVLAPAPTTTTTSPAPTQTTVPRTTTSISVG